MQRIQKLENLEITKVAFVPEGDNKEANVLLFKGKPGEQSGENSAADPELTARLEIDGIVGAKTRVALKRVER